MRKFLKTTKINLLTGASRVGGLNPTPAERSRGRFMRAPDGHEGGSDGAAAGGEAGAGAGGDAGNAGGAAGDAGGGEGGGAGAGADGAAAGGDGGAEEGKTILGEAAAADGDGSGAKESEDGKAGEGEEEKKDGAGDGAAIEVLGAPEAYDLKVPADLADTGVEFDKEAFAAIEPIVREMNLSNDAVQRIVDGYATKVLPLLQSRAEERADTFGADLAKTWEAEARADPEIGGAKFDETKALARQTFIKFGVKADSPFLTLMEESKLGSHPDMLRFVANVGRSTGEASVDLGGGGGAPARLADRVYGKPEPVKE